MQSGAFVVCSMLFSPCHQSQPTCQLIPALTLALALLFLTDYNELWPIHREAPPFTEQSTEQEVLVTGIKVG